MSLREGFTTGSAATAAAMAAFGRLIGLSISDAVDCPLPPFTEAPGLAPLPSGYLRIPLERVELDGETATAAVIKDGGDDPDATHRARIEAKAVLIDAARTSPQAGEILVPGFPPLLLRAGSGVGRATLPGLPVAVGEPAVNPVPRRQIQVGLREFAAQGGYEGGVQITLSVRDGELIARKTLNPRLGILGGISILGTHGTVRPYSHDAWKASILEGLNVAKAVGCPRVFLSTGRRSERLLQDMFPLDREQAFVQVADFAEFSLNSAVETGFCDIVWGCFFGKLVKLAQGLGHTHAHAARLEMELLARWCAEAATGDTLGGICELTRAVAACTTANQALEFILPRPDADAILRALALRAKCATESFAPGAQVNLILFSMNDDVRKELIRV